MNTNLYDRYVADLKLKSYAKRSIQSYMRALRQLQNFCCSAPIGEYNAVRPYSRVLEIDPITLKLKWEYSARTAGYGYHHHYVFYSPFVSSAQRLPNGNTLICEGDSLRVFEVTVNLETVWEYVLPPKMEKNLSYRAYRFPYDWVPQLDRPREKPVVPPDISSFHIEAQG